MNAAWQDAAYYNLAAIDCRRGNFKKALDLIDRSLVRNWHHHKARQLKVSILRHLGRKEEAFDLIAESLKIDRFNMGCRFEQYLLTGDDHVLKEMQRLMHGAAHVYIEYALDFAQAGLYDEAINLLGGTPPHKAKSTRWYITRWATATRVKETRSRRSNITKRPNRTTILTASPTASKKYWCCRMQ